MNRSMKAPGGEKIAKNLPPLRFEGTLTNSMRSTFLNCRKEFEWSYMRRLVPRTPNIPFLVGGLYHDGLEKMYTDKKFDRDEHQAYIDEAMDKASLTPGLSTDQSDKIIESGAVVLGMLIGYAKFYLKADLKIYKILELESEFEFTLKNKWKAKGKRDALFRKKKNKHLVLVEHKTTSQLNAAYILKLPLDNQILKYALSERRKNGILPDEVLYNVTLKPSIRQKQSESFNQYLKRLETEYLNNPTKYFYRETILITKQAVDRFEKELERFSTEMERAIKDEFFYQNTSQCTRYGKCAYMPLCVEGPTAMNLMKYRVKSRMHEELDDSKEEKRG